MQKFHLYQLIKYNKKFEEIENNISNLNHEITDVLVDGDIIYLVSHDKDKDCSNFQLFSAKLNLQKN